LFYLLVSVLKTGGFRRGGTKRRSSRSKRWSRSAQTLFASWAVIGQLGAIGVLVGEALEPQLAKAETGIVEIPGSYNATSSAFAIGLGATANSIGSQASGYQAKAQDNRTTAVGAGASASSNASSAFGFNATHRATGAKH
jgi:hypothetical protein